VQGMRSDLRIEAPRYVVWDALSDIRAVVAWNPGIDDVECLTKETTGLGARRRCFTHPSGWLTEAITEWDTGTSIAFSVDDAPPLKNGVARFGLRDEQENTRLVASFEYEMRLGPLGPVIDRLVVHRHLSAAWSRGLEGLRDFTEDQWRNAGANNSWTSTYTERENTK